MAESQIDIHVRTLLEGKPTAKRQAAEALGRIGAAAVPVMTEALGHKHKGVRNPAKAALAAMGPEAEAAFLDLLSHDNPRVREAGVCALQEHGIQTEASQTAIAKLVTDPAVAVRRVTHRYLYLTGETGTRAIVAVLRSSDIERKREFVGEIMGALPENVDTLVSLALELTHDEEMWVRVFATGILSKAENAGRMRLLELLNDPEEEVQINAANGLGAIGAVADTDLRRLLKDDNPHLVCMAAIAMGSRCLDGLPLLLEGLQDRKPHVRAIAIEHIGMLPYFMLFRKKTGNIDEAARSLLPALNDKDRHVRVAAAEALSNLDSSDPEVLAATKKVFSKSGRPFADLLRRYLERNDILQSKCSIGLGDDGSKDYQRSQMQALTEATENGRIVKGIKSFRRRLTNEGETLEFELNIEPQTAEEFVELKLGLAGSNYFCDHLSTSDLGQRMATEAAQLTLERLKVAKGNARTAGIRLLGELLNHNLPEDLYRKNGDLIVHAFEDSKRPVRAAALDAFKGQLSHFSSATAKLIDILQHSRFADERYKAASLLGECREDCGKVIPALLAALHDDNKEVRWFAARSLGTIRQEPETVLPALARMLKEDSQRSRAAEAIAEFGPDAVIILDDLIEAFDRQRDQWTKYQAVIALGNIGPDAAKALPVLRKKLTPRINGFIIDGILKSMVKIFTPEEAAEACRAKLPALFQVAPRSVLILASHLGPLASDFAPFLEEFTRSSMPEENEFDEKGRRLLLVDIEETLGHIHDS